MVYFAKTNFTYISIVFPLYNHYNFFLIFLLQSVHLILSAPLAFQESVHISLSEDLTCSNHFLPSMSRGFQQIQSTKYSRNSTHLQQPTLSNLQASDCNKRCVGQSVRIPERTNKAHYLSSAKKTTFRRILKSIVGTTPHFNILKPWLPLLLYQKAM